MSDQRERERLNEGLRLLRAFFRIADREQRHVLIDAVERAASAAPARPALKVAKLRLAGEEPAG
jgi:hypothetical protein